MKNDVFKFYSLVNCSLMLLIFLVFFYSCKKNSFIIGQNAQLTSSADSIKFDTVFTSIGSVTQSFKISNNNNQHLQLSTIRLMGGASSAFKINVNGNPSSEVTNVDVANGDSIYVFVTVNINPSSIDLPFIVKDSILIMYNGNKQFVQLEAYGQNAHFLRHKTITNNTVWQNDLPYVLLNGLQVNANATLTIQPGCKIYAHANSPMLVNGTLLINGTIQQQVIFSGDRMDEDYKYFSAAWPGIIFSPSSQNNILTHTILKNADKAISVQDAAINNQPKLTLHQCIIDNAFSAGLLAVHSGINADNCLITNCGTNISLSYGGSYNLTNCTVASYSNKYLSHKFPVLAINNFSSPASTTLTADLNANFTNCIFWGDNGIVNNEVTVDKQGANNFSVLFDHCLYKAQRRHMLPPCP